MCVCLCVCVWVCVGGWVGVCVRACVTWICFQSPWRSFIVSVWLGCVCVCVCLCAYVRVVMVTYCGRVVIVLLGSNTLECMWSVCDLEVEKENQLPLHEATGFYCCGVNANYWGIWLSLVHRSWGWHWYTTNNWLACVRSSALTTTSSPARQRYAVTSHHCTSIRDRVLSQGMVACAYLITPSTPTLHTSDALSVAALCDS